MYSLLNTHILHWVYTGVKLHRSRVATDGVYFITQEAELVSAELLGSWETTSSFTTPLALSFIDAFYSTAGAGIFHQLIARAGVRIQY